MSLTLSDMESLDSGTTVLVDGVQWERVENGLMRDGMVLGLMHFTGYLSAGKVTLLPLAWQEGCWYQQGVSFLLVTGIEDGQVTALAYPSASSVTPEPRSWSASDPLGSWHLIEQGQENGWMQRLRTALTTSPVGRVPQDLVTRLHSYAQNYSDGEFDNLLEEFGIGRETEHTSYVTISGHSYWTPSYEQASAYLGAEFSVDSMDDSITVYWSRNVTVTNTGIGCTCDAVDREWVRQYVPADVQDFDWEVECG